MNRGGETRAKKVARDNFIRANWHSPIDEIASGMISAGLYSVNTTPSDVRLSIMLRKKRLRPL